MKESSNIISLKIDLDSQKVPESIAWKSDNNQEKGFTECKAFLLSLFEKESKETFKIDLWTKDMQMIEMDRFVFYSLKSMADTYFRATGNKELANEFQNFADHFGRQTNILKPIE